MGSSSFKLLCNPDGHPMFVQMPYAEYDRTRQLAASADPSAGCLQKVRRIFSSTFTEAVASVPAGQPAARVPVSFSGSPELSPLGTPVEGSLQTASPPPAEIPVSQTKKPSVPSPKIKSVAAVAVPPALVTFINEQDPSRQIMGTVESSIRRLAETVGRRITLSLHKPYVCFWDFDHWQVFACCEITGGRLRLSVERSLMPDVSDVWNPPSGVFKKPMARIDVNGVTDDLIELLRTAVSAAA